MDTRIFCIHTVERYDLVRFANAVRDDTEALARNRECRVRAFGLAGTNSVLHAGNQNREILHVAAVQGKLGDPAIFDNTRRVWRFPYSAEHGARRDLHRLSYVADVQLDVLPNLRSCFYTDVAHGFGLKSLPSRRADRSCPPGLTETHNCRFRW